MASFLNDVILCLVRLPADRRTARLRLAAGACAGAQAIGACDVLGLSPARGTLRADACLALAQIGLLHASEAISEVRCE